MVELDPIRLKVLKMIQDSGTDLKNASLAIGRNAAYLHQYVTRGTPKVLPEDAREALAAHLGVDEEELRPRDRDARLPRRARRSRTSPPRRDGGAAERGSPASPSSTCVPRPDRAPSTTGRRRRPRSGCSQSRWCGTSSAPAPMTCG
ncbi:hypothetical protein ACFQU2_14230 [Siccirubricoccus deserti]